MSNTNSAAIKKLYGTFPQLTETNQQYVLGLAEGLKKAQNGRPQEQYQGSEKKPENANG
jgi:hypothetical protein